MSGQLEQRRGLEGHTSGVTAHICFIHSHNQEVFLNGSIPENICPRLQENMGKPTREKTDRHWLVQAPFSLQLWWWLNTWTWTHQTWRFHTLLHCQGPTDSVKDSLSSPAYNPHTDNHTRYYQEMLRWVSWMKWSSLRKGPKSQPGLLLYRCCFW